jgi:hypothetical protein
MVSQLLQRLFENGGIEWSRKPIRPFFRFEVRPDVFHADAFGVARFLQPSGPQVRIEVADAIEHGTNPPPGVRVEPAKIAACQSHDERLPLAPRTRASDR